MEKLKGLYFIGFYLTLLISPGILMGQFQDDFSSGSLETNSWTGDTSDFQISVNEELQLFNEDPASANTSMIIAPVATGDSTQWTFRFRYDFSPSASNFAQFMLAGDGPDVSNFNGYLLKLGGISGADDAIELIRQDGTSGTLLISGVVGALGGSTIDASVRCTRNLAGNWTLEMDNTGGSNYVLQGTANDLIHPVGSFLGVQCTYSSTRADKIFFDDINIGPGYVDDDPPILTNFNIPTANSIQLNFNETLDNSALQTANFLLDPAIGNISQTSFNNPESTNVLIEFENEFLDDQPYRLTINNISDIVGNNLQDTFILFDFLKVEAPEPWDIIFTEIMADPTPGVGLPEVEFVEIYNRSEKNIQLENMVFADGSSEFLLKNYILKKGTYLLLYKTEFGSIFESLPNAMGLSNFPSLTNDGEELKILDTDDNLINAVDYSIEWYNNSDRDDGGYTLELIDTSMPCLLEENWAASTSNIGGTPGSENANASINLELDPFQIINIAPNSINEIQIEFNRSLSIDLLDHPEFIDVNGFNVSSLNFETESQNILNVQFSEPFDTNVVYECCLNLETLDCLSNPIQQEACSLFGIPIAPTPGDILINEVLFNPLTGGSDFVELINPTDNIYSLSSLFIGSVDSNDLPFQVSQISASNLILPNVHIALSENPSNVKLNYEVPNPNQLLNSNLPTLADSDGTVLLLFGNFPTLDIIDRLDYEDDWHNPLFDIIDGISLERLSIIDETNNRENWRSASQTVGFGTPTGPNSQSIPDLTSGTSPFTFPDRFSPDDDGFEDFLSINYEEAEKDFLLNIKVFDIQGRLIKNIAQNFFAGRQAFFRWDGETLDGNKAKMGIYILWMERFTADGDLERFKFPIILAERL